ncbi:DUF2235 domain-containing protein [Cellulomonas sp. PhB143]|uniref:DUF2235 domain-containing protein n=1 Tax=Cellulomonas sp. PhB143 TaxID=2485186 RepID=UPI000F48751F|nr:DUF2235 domain-containing protein [Cellulomonas sp. PhB143]ROS76872.1 putative alpha/beta hydrolase family protein DUF2235 [Cellulomonas sp. PhB143]
MKRLVLCCDGTWNSPVRESVSNVEKIARAVDTGVMPDGVEQVVFTVGGVGAGGYTVDRLLGGAFGYGLTQHVVDGYRVLALNYEPGDEVYVFGFSRGAYTARSIVGMTAAVGLLRPGAVLQNRLRDAERLYRARSDANAAERQAFRDEFAYRTLPVAMLGVFDTVGELGVPGVTSRRSRFHDVRLSDDVRCARQALSIDDRRLKFAPCLWEVPDGAAPGRVKQVWFPGAHSDVGGGTQHQALSDVTLRWMLEEARALGLVVDPERLDAQLDDEPLFQLRCAPGPLYAAINLWRRLRRHPGFRGDRRVLEPTSPGDGVRISSTAVRLSGPGAGDYGAFARNIGWWRERAGEDFGGAVEPIAFAEHDERRLVVL